MFSGKFFPGGVIIDPKVFDPGFSEVLCRLIPKMMVTFSENITEND